MYGNKLARSILCFLVHGSVRSVLGLLAEFQFSTHLFFKFFLSYILTHSDLGLFVSQHLSALHFVLHVKLQFGALCCSILLVQQQLGSLRFVIVRRATTLRALI